MSESSVELSLFYESFMNHTINLSYNSLSLSEIETISKTNFAKHYHLLCKTCETIPKIRFFKNKKIKYKCDCGDLLINDIHKIYDYLDYSEIIDIENIKLKCKNHPDEKYCLYCTKCQINLCYKCANNCIEHIDKIKIFPLDKNIINKRDYIIEKIKDKNQTYIDDEDHKLNKNYTTEDEDDNCNKFFKLQKKINLKENDDDNIDNDDISEEDIYLISKKINKNIITNKAKKEIKSELINIMNEDNIDDLMDGEYYLINLISIIVDDFQNYPNYELNKIISNLEKFIFLYYGNYQELDLQYEFEKDDIKNYSVDILGKKFVETNKEKCFLIINEKLIDINNSICLKDIYTNFKLNKIVNWPIQLNVELVEKDNNKMTDLSYMFEGISNLMPTSNFNNFDSTNITKTDNMFYNCSSLTELPDISNLNVSNVIDMRCMFSGCKSLKKLPDISKWNTNKLINIEGMFEYCESLIFLPDISNLNKNKSINNKAGLFNNCKSLEIVPDLSNLFREEELKDNYIFEGCTKLEEKLKGNNKENRKIIVKYLLKNFPSKICKYFFYIIGIFLFIYFCYYLFLFHLYNSFNLTVSNKYFNDPKAFCDLLNTINISYITEINNDNELIKIKRISENKEEFINKELNFTFINANMTFESTKKYIRVYSIIITSISFLNILVVFFIKIFPNTLENVPSILKIIFLIFLLIINVFALIIEIKDSNIIEIFTNSFDIFIEKLNKLFNLKFDQLILDEFNSLKESLKSIDYNIILSIIIILIISFRLNNLIKEKIGQNNSFEKNKIILNSNTDNQV